MSHPVIEPEALGTVLAAYPDLGELRAITRNGLSVNTATGLFDTARGTYFAKAYDPLQREPMSILAEHALVGHLVAAGFPTPPLRMNQAGTTVTWHEGRAYVLSEVARGEDRYGGVGVFEPFASLHEARGAGTALARFHLALADGPRLAPKPFRGLTARYELMAAPSLRAGLDELLDAAPVLEGFLEGRLGWGGILGFLGDRRPAVVEHLPFLHRGLIHGDFIKRNLFWGGHEVTDVIDFDLWNVGYWVYDLALALLPCGFDWPALLRGEGSPRIRDMQAMLAGYQSVRLLSEAEAAALVPVLETARVEFYLGAVAAMLVRGEAAQAERFFDLLVGTTRWFQAHPGWASEAALF